MKIFVAGGTGAIGRFLVPQLIAAGHEVVGLARNDAKAGQLEAAGAKPAIADPLNRDALTAAIVDTRPEVVIHELTAISSLGDLKNLDHEFELTNRFRTEVTDTMLAAARTAGARRFIAQSFCGWPFAPEGGPVKTEEDPLNPDPPHGFSETLAAITHVEDAVMGSTDLPALALRYGFFYGPGTGISSDGAMVDLVRQHKIPLVGDGGGIWSFCHIEDAARATVAAVAKGEPGLYNIVDDDPAPVSEWLPILAETVGARAPSHVPAWMAKIAIGEGGVAMMTRNRGGANAKAKRELGWEPQYKSWRTGFVEGLG